MNDKITREHFEVQAASLTAVANTLVDRVGIEQARLMLIAAGVGLALQNESSDTIADWLRRIADELDEFAGPQFSGRA